jgi:hypothetical protein
VKVWPATFTTVGGSFKKKGISAILKQPSATKVAMSMATGALLASGMRFVRPLMLGLLPDDDDDGVHTSLTHYTGWIKLTDKHSVTAHEQKGIDSQSVTMQSSVVAAWGSAAFAKVPKFAAHRQVDSLYMGPVPQHLEDWGGGIAASLNSHLCALLCGGTPVTAPPVTAPPTEAFMRKLKRAFKATNKRTPLAQIAFKLVADAVVEHLSAVACMADRTAAYAAANGRFSELRALITNNRESGHAHVQARLTPLAPSPQSCPDPLCDNPRVSHPHPSFASTLMTTVQVVGLDAATDDEGTPLLALAARGGHPACVTLLLEAGADVELRSRVLGASALTLACAHGHARCVQLLLEANAQEHRWRGHLSFEWAARRAHAGVLQVLGPAARPAPGGVILKSDSEVSSEPLNTRGIPFDSRTYTVSRLSIDAIAEHLASWPQLEYLRYWVTIFMDGGERSSSEGFRERARPKRPQLLPGHQGALSAKFTSLCPGVRFCTVRMHSGRTPCSAVRPHNVHIAWASALIRKGERMC